MPQVSVLMSVFNGAEFLEEAINSILRQTFSDFEFLIIDDGSTDSSREVISSFVDRRIRLVCNNKNIGLAASLNKGIALARGIYIARMDSDDISHSHRLAAQVDFMDRHSDVGVCGTWVTTFGDGENLEWRYAVKSEDIKCSLLFESPFAHPSVMLRRSILIDNGIYYDESLQVAQDYDLWTKLSEVTIFANLPSFLYYYRRHQGQIGQKKILEQAAASRKVRHFLLSKLTSSLTSADLVMHEAICVKQYENSKDFVLNAEKWLLRLLSLNQRTQVYPELTLGEALAYRWLDLCMRSTSLGFWMIKKYIDSPLSDLVKSSNLVKMRLVLSCATCNKLPWAKL